LERQGRDHEAEVGPLSESIRPAPDRSGDLDGRFQSDALVAQIGEGLDRIRDQGRELFDFSGDARPLRDLAGEAYPIDFAESIRHARDRGEVSSRRGSGISTLQVQHVEAGDSGHENRVAIAEFNRLCRRSIPEFDTPAG
jgi:hypothetical protein